MKTGFAICLKAGSQRDAEIAARPWIASTVTAALKEYASREKRADQELSSGHAIVVLGKGQRRTEQVAGQKDMWIVWQLIDMPDDAQPGLSVSAHGVTPLFVRGREPLETFLHQRVDELAPDYPGHKRSRFRYEANKRLFQVVVSLFRPHDKPNTE